MKEGQSRVEMKSRWEVEGQGEKAERLARTRSRQARSTVVTGRRMARKTDVAHALGLEATWGSKQRDEHRKGPYRGPCRCRRSSGQSSEMVGDTPQYAKRVVFGCQHQKV